MEKNEQEEIFENISKKPLSMKALQSDWEGGESYEFAYPLQKEIHEIQDKYVGSELIGTGGGKEVYKVFDTHTYQYVAMAKMKRNGDREEIENFYKEARLTASLKHPNIISIYHLGYAEDDTPFFTMELLEGEDLDVVIKDGFKSEESLMETFLKICDAIAYVHSCKVVHLDLKPSNIKLGKYGEVHVYDWGLASRWDSISEESPHGDAIEEDYDLFSSHTQVGMIRGTPGYMAPEQLEYGTNKDERADIYSLGAILYTILLGHSPIDNKDSSECIENTRKGKFLRSDRFQALSPSLQSILIKSMSLKPADRYESVSHLQADLRKYLHGYAPYAQDAGFFTQLALLANRNRRKIQIASSLFVLFLIIIAYSMFKINESRKIAIEKKNEAIEMMGLANRNFDLYNEQNAKRSVLEEQARLMTSGVRLHNITKEKISILEESYNITEDSDLKISIKQRLGQFYFINLDFQNALKSYEDAGESSWRDIDRLLVGGSKHAMALLKKKPQLSIKEYFNILKISTPDWHYLVANYYLANLLKTFEGEFVPKDYLKILKLVIDVNNNIKGTNQETKTFQYSNGVLKFPKAPYSKISILGVDIKEVYAPLNLKVLDLSDTSFFHLQELKGLPIEVLKIQNCPIFEIKDYEASLFKQNGIKEIFLTENNFTKNNLEKLKANFIIRGNTSP
jgi:serine/threonine-protein kinase